MKELEKENKTLRNRIRTWEMKPKFIVLVSSNSFFYVATLSKHVVMEHIIFVVLIAMYVYSFLMVR